MKKNKTVITIFLVLMTLVLLGTTVYISTLLSSPSSPTQIQKTKAAAVTYTRNVVLFPTGMTQEPSPSKGPTVTIGPTTIPVLTKAPTALPSKTPTLLAQAPTLIPTLIPTINPTLVPTKVQIITPLPPTVTPLVATPTSQPLLAYNSTTISPTPIPTTSTTLSPTKQTQPTQVQPTGVQQLPETGWVQISSILFIVATTTILFSLLF